MTGEVLRRAAGLMRERAEAAATWDGHWLVHPKRPGRVIEDKNGWNDAIVASCVDYGGSENGARQAAHIASWNPAVALAVADWLDATAARIEEIHESLPFSARLTLESLNVTAAEQALAVARAYLRDSA